MTDTGGNQGVEGAAQQHNRAKAEGAHELEECEKRMASAQPNSEVWQQCLTGENNGQDAHFRIQPVGHQVAVM
jgi:hypothetical protein